MASFVERLRSGFNAFVEQEQPGYVPPPTGPASYSGFYGVNPNRGRRLISNERSIIASIYTRLSLDIALVPVRHTRHDDNDRYDSDMPSGLNDCLKVEANLDQSAFAFMLDVILTIFDKGVAAIVPVDTTIDPKISGSYDIKTLRVGEITQWYPNHIRASVYNEKVGYRQEIVLEKRSVAIIENPLYSVMNETNSTLQRLIRKLGLLDTVDEASSSGKLDLIVQLPYTIKSEMRRNQAEDRRKDIEFQLKGSKYGIAYTDATEKITQLNRPTENNMLDQITLLTNQLYVELGVTPEVMNGTANEAAMLNYNNRTVLPLLTAITQGMARVFLTKTARSQGQAIDFFRDPFKLVPMASIADVADKFTRNEIFTANEIRQFMGVKPSTDSKADQLVNSNNISYTQVGNGTPTADNGPNAQPPDTGDDTQTDPTDDETDDGSDAAVTQAAPAGPSPLDTVGDAISSVFTQFGAPAPSEDDLTPPGGDLDPDVTLDSLDELDKAVDEMFSGLE